MAKPNAAQTTNTKPTIDQILDMKKPLEIEVDVLVHPEYQQRLQELEQEKLRAQSNRSKADLSQPGVAKIEQQIEELLEEAQEYVVTFKLRDIGRKKLNDLAQKHPPTKEQTDQYKKLGAPGVLEYNPDTFGPALLTAVCIEPEMTLDAAERIFEEWGAGEVDSLFNACLRVTQGRASIPLSKRGSAKTSISG